MSSTTCIEDLPPEMICELFEYLPLKDLVACSMVNRRWHSIYVAFKLHRLAAINFAGPFNYGPIKWHNSNRRVEEVERCMPAMFRHLAAKPLLSNLKQLALTGYDSEFDLNHLNRYQQLVHLEIDITFLDKSNVQLKLSKLKVLAFHRSNLNCSLSIDCPELSTMLYNGNVNQLDVKHPETIRKLQTDWFSYEMTPFKSVECLVTKKYQAISLATLISLPRLRELHYNREMDSLFFYDFGKVVNIVGRVKRTLIEFMDEAKRLRGSDFQFTFCGLQVANVNVDQIDFGMYVNEASGRERVCNEYVYLKNYHLIEPGAMHFVYWIDYNRLLSNVTGEFPLCFSQKFTGIEEVHVDGVVEDPDHLLWFLKSLRFLRSLGFKTTKLSQEFYDQLPTAAYSLEKLEFVNNELQLNFDFIGKFSHLLHLAIRPALSLEAATSLVPSLGGLFACFFHAASKGKYYIISKRIKSRWRIVSHLKEFKTRHPEKMIDLFK